MPPCVNKTYKNIPYCCGIGFVLQRRKATNQNHPASGLAKAHENLLQNGSMGRMGWRAHSNPTTSEKENEDCAVKRHPAFELS
jgi:hypothetical protein